MPIQVYVVQIQVVIIIPLHILLKHEQLAFFMVALEAFRTI